MEGLNVFFGGYRLDNFTDIVTGRQRKLHQNTVNIMVTVKLVNKTLTPSICLMLGVF